MLIRHYRGKRQRGYSYALYHPSTGVVWVRGWTLPREPITTTDPF